MLRKIRIMYLINSFSFGGAEKLVFDLVTALDKKKFDIFVCAMVSRDDKIEKSIRANLEKLGVKTIVLKKRARRDRIKAIWRLFHVLRRNEIDILHAHSPSSGFYGRMAALGMKKLRVFTTVHNTKGYSSILEKFLVPFTTYYIAISDRVQRYMTKTLGIPNQKIALIYNAINANKFRSAEVDRDRKLKELNLPLSSSVISTIGRITQQKGHIYLLEAAEIVLRNFADARFLIVGDDTVDPETAKKIREMIRKKNLQDRVILTGVRTDIAEIFAITDVFVLPSLWEGLPLVLLEAMASGVPVVVTDVGSNAEVVEDGVSGFVVPPQNPVLLAQKIREILNNPQRAAEIGSAARQRINEQFSLERLAREHEALYLDALKSAKI